jgi:hypothetical protein
LLFKTCAFDLEMWFRKAFRNCWIVKVVPGKILYNIALLPMLTKTSACI